MVSRERQGAVLKDAGRSLGSSTWDNRGHCQHSTGPKGKKRAKHRGSGTHSTPGAWSAGSRFGRRPLEPEAREPSAHRLIPRSEAPTTGDGADPGHILDSRCAHPIGRQHGAGRRVCRARHRRARHHRRGPIRPASQNPRRGAPGRARESWQPSPMVATFENPLHPGVEATFINRRSTDIEVDGRGKRHHSNMENARGTFRNWKR